MRQKIYIPRDIWPYIKLHTELKDTCVDLKGVLVYTGVLSHTRKETSYSNRRFWVSYILFI